MDLDRRALAAAALAGFAGIAVLAGASCGDVTELVVVVDTDLAPGADIDRVEVRVSGPGGFEAEPKSRAVTGAEAFPLTLGVVAGSDEAAPVTVTAIGTRSGGEVARTVARAKMTPGTSRVLHVSLCKACGTTCAVDLGDALASWDGKPFEKNACDEPAFTDAGPSGPEAGAEGGGPDAGADATPPGADGGDAGDGGLTGPCGAGCPTGTTCKEPFGCEVTSEPACNASEIAIPAAGGVFFGEVCWGAAVETDVCGVSRPAHHFLVSGTRDVDVELDVNTTNGFTTLRVSPLCGAVSPCNGVGGTKKNHSLGTVTPPTIVRLETQAESPGCSAYELRFRPR